MISPARTLLALLREHRPPPEQRMLVHGWRPAAPIEVGAPFTVLSWNLQFCGSRRHHFFYDGGRASHVPVADVAGTLAAISAVLDQQAPDLCLLQEIDRDADRTGRRDQLPALVAGARAATSATATYHRSRYVPKPAHQPLGRVDLQLGLLSGAPLTDVVRHQLALKQTSRLVQAFDLKRCLLTGRVGLSDGRSLHVAVTHLSAFSYSDGTLHRQVAALDAWMSSRPDGEPWVLGGDLNLLPPGDDPTRLSVEHELYDSEHNAIGRLLPRHREVLGIDNQLHVDNRTYVPFGAARPDRKIDYLFVGGPVDVVSAEVVQELTLSDHLPVRAVLRVQPER